MDGEKSLFMCCPDLPMISMISGISSEEIWKIYFGKCRLAIYPSGPSICVSNVDQRLWQMSWGWWWKWCWIQNPGPLVDLDQIFDDKRAYMWLATFWWQKSTYFRMNNVHPKICWLNINFWEIVDSLRVNNNFWEKFISFFGGKVVTFGGLLSL